MLNFVKIVETQKKKGLIYVEPKFSISVKDPDVMIRGKDFYAVWDEESGLWQKDEKVVIKLIDEAVWEKFNSIRKKKDIVYVPILMDDSDSGAIDKWHKYVQKQMRDNAKDLDNKIIFANTKTTKNDYVTKRLPYAVEPGDISAYEEIMSTLYDPSERLKLEWALGAILTGDSKSIQKFIVLYGSYGTGKSTFLNIIEQLFEGYWNTFNAKDLGAAKDFALESFKDNPLISIQHDGDLSKIADNTMINSIASHETMLVNEKYKSQYPMKFNTFMIMGSNKTVKITDSKSGLLRRLIDVNPSGRLIPSDRYDELTSRIQYELGAIAHYLITNYKQLGPKYYNSYVPMKMWAATNDFYDFVDYYYSDFENSEFMTVNEIWGLYKAYCDMAKVKFQFSLREMIEEIRGYFDDYKESYFCEGKHYRRVFFGFKKDKFGKVEVKKSKTEKQSWLNFNTHKSLFDVAYFDWPAQYGVGEDSKPQYRWLNVETTLSELDTSKVHYVLPKDKRLIMLDFDKKDESGKKSLQLNMEAAFKFPPTYGELSKSGGGIHLYYIYTGDISLLDSKFANDQDVEIKTFKGGSSIRRCVTKCNDIQIATISSGLPLKKEVTRVVDEHVLKDEKHLRQLILNNLDKMYADNTTQSVHYIYEQLEKAYNTPGFVYDVNDLQQKILTFASKSRNQRAHCVELVSKMHFKSKDDPIDQPFEDTAEIVFFDVEVFKNLFLLVWKIRGTKKYNVLYNPSPKQIMDLLDKKIKLVGFNNRRYDNHIMYGRAQGYNNMELYKLSTRLISSEKGVNNSAMFANAYNLSYADVYDFCSKKQSLKKWEIELHIHHKECEYNWNEEVAESEWENIAKYCMYDVAATEATFEANYGDFVARQMLSIISGLSVNTPDNAHSAAIIFGDDMKDPSYKNQFVYTDLSTIFPGYKFDNGVSTYLGETVGEGGAVRAVPGMYGETWVFDIVSMHPHSAIALNIFGDKYTKVFKSLVDLRVAIKHGDTDAIRNMFDGKLVPYIEDKANLKAIAQALKIVINSVYGLTSAHFDNPFKDKRNIDNIVAKRGALFMLTLRKELENMGVNVLHIKTDSIKIPKPTEKVQKFITDFAKKYGYEFEIEHKFERFCLVNDAVYIAKYKEAEDDHGKEKWWDATGKEFAVPYVYKTLFSHEDINFYDLCETRSVKTSMYLDMNEQNKDEHNYVFVGKVGLFCPIKPGYGGGLLVAQRKDKDGNDKYDSVTGVKGYRWLEAEDVDPNNYCDVIDFSYYNKLADDAKKHIEKYGDFTLFTA